VLRSEESISTAPPEAESTPAAETTISEDTGSTTGSSEEGSTSGSGAGTGGAGAGTGTGAGRGHAEVPVQDAISSTTSSRRYDSVPLEGLSVSLPVTGVELLAFDLGEALPDLQWGTLDYELRRMGAGSRLSATSSGSDPNETPGEEFARNLVSTEGAIRVTGAVMLAGAVAWAIHGPSLLTALVASAPAWRHIDPLPILGPEQERLKRGQEASDEESQEDDAAANLWDVEDAHYRMRRAA
jgi:hypothetical protein